jgi:hypothetical protein
MGDSSRDVGKSPRHLRQNTAAGNFLPECNCLRTPILRARPRDRGRFRVFSLYPMRRASRAIGRAKSFGPDALARMMDRGAERSHSRRASQIAAAYQKRYQLAALRFTRLRTAMVEASCRLLSLL